MLDYDKLKNDLSDLDEEAVIEAVKNVIKDGGAEAAKAMEACQEGMSLVGSRFESGEYFVADLIFSGEIMKEALEILKPALVGKSSERLGKLLLCTVKDDLHDIGKNIVKAILEASGLEVIDLGIDVPASTVVTAAKAENIRIIALSGVLTLAVDSMKNTVDAIKSAGLREKTKIIIGGAPVSAEACSIVGADAWAHSPQDTLKTCLAWAKA